MQATSIATGSLIEGRKIGSAPETADAAATLNAVQR
jgi:hypothetical protein